MVAAANDAIDRRDVEDSPHMVRIGQRAAAGRDDHSRVDLLPAAHLGAQFVGDGVLDDVADVVPACPEIADQRRDRCIEDPRHLHVDVLGADPDVDLVVGSARVEIHVAQVAGDQPDLPAVRVRRRVTKDPRSGDRPLPRTDFEPGDGGMDETVAGARQHAVADEAADHRPRLRDLLRVRRVVIDAVHAGNVERVSRSFAADEHGHPVPERMAYTELVEHVRVGGADVDHRNLGVEDVVDHPLVDETGLLDLVAAQTAEVDPVRRQRFHRRLDDLRVDGVEVDQRAVIVLLAEGHDDETQPSRFVVRLFVRHVVPLSAVRPGGRCRYGNGRAASHCTPMIVFASARLRVSQSALTQRFLRRRHRHADDADLLLLRRNPPAGADAPRVADLGVVEPDALG
ncbi:MAG: hypothetical protein AW12_01772 [Candidatus Accumulibacter sp. BA-94]|nr:MAG: hypothetical protein AW12_01772 [Candidatus Accumulibacter sp. BA-94]